MRRQFNQGRKGLRSKLTAVVVATAMLISGIAAGTAFAVDDTANPDTRQENTSLNNITAQSGIEDGQTDGMTESGTADEATKPDAAVMQGANAMKARASENEQQGIAFQYVEEKDINDNQSISERNAIKYSIVLIDENGKESYTLPAGSEVDSYVKFDSNTVNMTSTVTYEQMGISVPGYTFDKSYAFFYWHGNYQGDKNDVVLFHNFGDYSTTYQQSYKSYIGFTRSDASGSDYSSHDFGPAGKGYFAYNPTGTLRIVLHKVTGNTHYQAHFVDAYMQVENASTFATTEMTTGQENGHYYGMLNSLPTGTPSREGYTFAGWYMDMDDDGNGTGTRVSAPSDDQTHYQTDATYYAKWTPLPASGEPDHPSHHKYVKDNGDGTYDLSLDVHGQVSTSQDEPTKIDLLYVLDNSSSMFDNTMEDSKTLRMEAATAAITTMDTSLSEQSGLSMQRAVVVFRDDAATHQGWSNELNIDNIGRYEGGGDGTDYAAALKEAKQVLQHADSNAIKVVVFVSDGYPTEGDGDYGDKLEAAEKVVRDLSADYFYTVGVGDEIGQNKLDQLASSADLVPQSNRGAYASNNAEELIQIFAGLAANITRVDCRNVVISDTLSSYAQLTNDAKFIISVSDASGKSVAGIEVSRTDAESAGGKSIEFDGTSATVTYQNGVISLDFDDGYVLKNGWTYTITTRIQPTETAYDTYISSNGYDATGAPDTDAVDNETSSGQLGFKSNAASNLTYTSNGTQVDYYPYPDPVIQVKFGTLEVSKSWSDGNENHSNTDVQVALYRDGYDTGVRVDLSNENSWSGAFDHLVPGHKYTVQEVQVPDGYTASYEYAGAGANDNGVTLSAESVYGSGSDAAASVVVTNTVNEFMYVAANHLTLSKRLLNGDLQEGQFSFQLQVEYEPDGGDAILYRLGSTTQVGADTEIVENGNYNDNNVGLFQFGDIEFTKPGIYAVSVREVDKSKGNISYDDHVLYVRYEITSDMHMKRWIASPVDNTMPDVDSADDVWTYADKNLSDSAKSWLTWTNTCISVSSLPLTGGVLTPRNFAVVGVAVLLLAGGAWLLARRRLV